MVKKYMCSAVMSSVLSETILAENQTEAEEKFDEHLENGSVPEITWSGAIDDIQVEEIKEEGEKK